MGGCCAKGNKKPEKVQLAETYNLSQEQVDQYEKLFKSIDVNGDGKITEVELGVAMEKLMGVKHSKKALKNMIQTNDTDGSGAMEFPEFLALLSTMKPLTEAEKQAMEAFAVFDKNKDGFITAKELRVTLKKLKLKVSQQELDQMLNDVDRYRDGRINREEFLMMYRQIAAGP